MDDSHMIKNSGPNAEGPHTHIPSHSNMLSDQNLPQNKPVFTIGVPEKFLFGHGTAGSTETNTSLVKEQDLEARILRDQKTFGGPGMKRCSSSPGLLNTTHTGTVGKINVTENEAPHARKQMADATSKMIEKSLEKSLSKSLEKSLDISNSKSLPNTPSGSPKHLRKQMVEYHGKHAINKFGSMFRKKNDTVLPKISEDNDGMEKMSNMRLSERLKNWMVHTPVVSTQKDMNIYSPTSF